MSRWSRVHDQMVRATSGLPASSATSMAAGLSIVFGCGVAWLAWVAQPAPVGLPAALRTGLLPFLVADAIKVALAATVLPAVWRVIGR